MDHKPESEKDIEKIALNILKDSRSYGIFPTPVDKIIQYSELKVNKNIDLSHVNLSLFSKVHNLFIDVKRKLLGMIDFGFKEIYLDSTQNSNKKRFIKLHEVGHNSLPWQKEIFSYYIDDKRTLDASTKLEFESEASYFASSVLFQLDIFDYESSKLPLSISSAMYLSKKFGASNHSSMRRYVENSTKRCALLILERDPNMPYPCISIRNYFQSNSFTNEFGELDFNKEINLKSPFIVDVNIGKRFHEKGILQMDTTLNQSDKFNYHFFNNSYNYFIFLFPFGEFIKSRKKIYLT